MIAFYLFISICVSLLENKYDCRRKYCWEFVETVLFFVYYDVCVCKLLFERAISLISGSGKKYIYVVCFYARLDTDLVMLSRVDWLFRLANFWLVVSVIFLYCPGSPESLKFILFGVIKCQVKGFYTKDTETEREFYDTFCFLIMFIFCDFWRDFLVLILVLILFLSCWLLSGVIDLMAKETLASQTSYALIDYTKISKKIGKLEKCPPWEFWFQEKLNQK